jgi:O-antigen/teichoic acid export membrane protein
MPKEEFGEFGFLFTSAVTASTLMSLNLYVIIIRDLSKNINFFNKKKIFSTLIIFIILFNLFFLFLILFLEYNFYLVSNFYGIQNLKLEKIIFILLIIFFNVISLFQYSLILSRKKTIEICIFIFSKFAFANCVCLYLLINFNTHYDTVFLRLLGILIAEIILFIFMQLIIQKNFISFYFDWIYLKSKILTTSPLIVSTLISFILVNIDRKILQLYYGNFYLADYNLVYLLLLPLSMIMSSLQSIWSPKLFSIKNYQLAFEETNNLLKYIFLFLLFVSVLIYFTTFILFNFKFINISYYSVLPLFLTMVPGIIFGVLINFLDGLNLYLNKTHYKLIITLVVSIIFSFMCIILIPNYNYFGIAGSLFIANFLGFLLGYFLVLNNFKKR